MLWDSNGKLVQIYIGRQVLNYYTHQDNRGFIRKWMGDTAPKPGQILAQVYKKLQKEWESENITLPDADMQQNDMLPSDNALIYFGCECRQFPVQIADGNDSLVIFLYQKARQYSAFDRSRRNIQNSISRSVNGIPTERGDSILETLSQSYFWSSLQDYNHEAAISLGYAGNFALRAFNIQDASSFIVKALSISLSTNSVDAVTKTAIANDAGTALRILGTNLFCQGFQEKAVPALQLSKKCYEHAIKISEINHDYGRLFFAICGCAGSCLALNDLINSEKLLERALSMTSESEVQRDIYSVLHHIAKKQVSQLLLINNTLRNNLNEALQEIERNKFINKLSDFFLPLLFHATTALIYAGAGILGVNIKLSNVNINGPSIIGYRNLQNLFWRT